MYLHGVDQAGTASKTSTTMTNDGFRRVFPTTPVSKAKAAMLIPCRFLLVHATILSCPQGWASRLEAYRSGLGVMQREIADLLGVCRASPAQITSSHLLVTRTTLCLCNVK